MGMTPHIDDDRDEHSATVGTEAVAADALYNAALADLLARAGRRPGVLDRLCSLVRKLHARRRSDGEPLPLEYWFWGK